MLVTKVWWNAAFEQESVWWPGKGRQLEGLVNQCSVCRKYRRNHAEPLTAPELPDYPLQKVASDRLFCRRKTYLIVIDYYSRYIEVSLLASNKSQSIIASLKTVFSVFGIPETFLSDNGPNYVSKDFVNFTKDYGFTHVTSSPLYAQANGESELAVQTVKRSFGECSDPHLPLLAYLWNKYIAPHNFLRNEICVRRYQYIPASWDRVWVHQNVLTRRTLNSSRSRKRTVIHLIEFTTCLPRPPVTKFTFQNEDKRHCSKKVWLKELHRANASWSGTPGTKDISTRCPKKW